jgi:hypothetical protein
MESGEWRYGQADDERPWARAQEPESEAAPDLWAEQTSPWGSTSSTWTPAVPRIPEPTTSSDGWSAWGTPSRDRTPTNPPAPTDPRENTNGWNRPSNEWGQPRHVAPPTSVPPAPAANSLPPAPAVTSLPPLSTNGSSSYGYSTLETSGGFARPQGAGASQPVSSPPSRSGAIVRTGVDTWNPPAMARRARDPEEDEFAPERRKTETFGDEPAYGPVLGFTAGWYGVPAVLYFVWLVTLDSDRQSFVMRQFVGSLPWLFAAVVLSLAVAGLLRWAVVGWRALTLSFAAAVIGAGVTTIAHSLAL